MDQVRALPALNEVGEDGKRFLKALKWNEKPFSFSLEDLDEKKLTQLAKITNSATVHCSGNCVALAMALFYNLKIGSMEISVGNTAPFYRGLSPKSCSDILFNQPTTSVGHCTAFALKQKLLDNSNQTGERVFMILAAARHSGWGHSFNAVILGENDNQRIIFTDSWHSCA